MDEFINRIIRLDKSIDDLELEFNNKKHAKNLEYKSKEEELRKRYEEYFLKEKSDYYIQSKELINEEKRKNNYLKDRKYEEINKKYLENKDRLVSEIFDEYFRKL